MTVKAGSSLIGHQICDPEGQLDFSAIFRNRGSQVDLHPLPYTTLEAGDQVCVFASVDVLNRLGRLNKATTLQAFSSHGQCPWL
jgi:hypothetical protein